MSASCHFLPTDAVYIMTRGWGINYHPVSFAHKIPIVLTIVRYELVRFPFLQVMSSCDFHSCRLWSMENYSISNIGRGLDLKVASLSLSVITNNNGVLFQSNCNRMPTWTLCAVDSRGCPTKFDPFSCTTVTFSFINHPTKLEAHVRLLGVDVAITNSHYFRAATWQTIITPCLPQPFQFSLKRQVQSSNITTVYLNFSTTTKFFCSIESTTTAAAEHH